MEKGKATNSSILPREFQESDTIEQLNCTELSDSAENPGSIPRLEDLLEKEMATHSSILAWRIT